MNNFEKREQAELIDNVRQAGLVIMNLALLAWRSSARSQYLAAATFAALKCAALESMMD